MSADEAVEARCKECERSFYVIDEPNTCPYCGAADVGAEHAVVIRPH